MVGILHPEVYNGGYTRLSCTTVGIHASHAPRWVSLTLRSTTVGIPHPKVNNGGYTPLLSCYTGGYTPLLSCYTGGYSSQVYTSGWVFLTGLYLRVGLSPGLTWVIPSFSPGCYFPFHCWSMLLAHTTVHILLSVVPGTDPGAGVPLNVVNSRFLGRTNIRVLIITVL